MGVRVAFHDRRTDGLLCVLAFVLFASTFSRRIVSVSNKMQYFNVTPSRRESIISEGSASSSIWHRFKIY